MKKETTHTGPSANTLYQDPGFNPMKYARKTVNKAGDTLMELELPHKRLWFRQACPDGSMLLNALRITDQLAIFEAKVFFSKEDLLPASSFVASKTAKETPKYIRDAQDEALSAALDNAGFGVHLYGASPASVGEQAEAQPETAAEQKPEATPKQKPETTAELKPETTPEQKLETTPEQKAETVLDSQVKSVTSELASILNFPVPGGKPAQIQGDFPAQTDGGMSGPAEETSEVPASSQTSYTDDTPVEEICRCMTLEEAHSLVLKTGINKGSTLGEVKIKCPSSLYYYIAPHSKCGNIQKAGATLLLREMEAVRQSEENRVKAG